jgi:excisionase family DNA binding protein
MISQATIALMDKLLADREVTVENRGLSQNLLIWEGPMLSRRKNVTVFDPQSLLTPKEVCTLFKITRRTLQRWCHSKPQQMPYISLGPHTVRFRRSLIEYILKQREISGSCHVETDVT